jgi:hypothetical protein
MTKEIIMKRFAKSLVVILVLLSFGLAQAQITIQSVARSTGCELIAQDGLHTIWSDGDGALGPYFMDLDVDQGDQHLRSIHDSAIILDESTLTVSGSFLGTVSTDDPASIISLMAVANLIVNFTPTDPSTVAIEVTFSGNGEVYFFDMTEWNGDFDHQGPGVFTLDDTLIAGHEYLFQVFYSVGIYPGGQQQAEESATFSLAVVQEPVATEAASWGAVKALYR